MLKLLRQTEKVTNKTGNVAIRTTCITIFSEWETERKKHSQCVPKKVKAHPFHNAVAKRRTQLSPAFDLWWVVQDVFRRWREDVQIWVQPNPWVHSVWWCRFEAEGATNSITLSAPIKLHETKATTLVLLCMFKHLWNLRIISPFCWVGSRRRRRRRRRNGFCQLSYFYFWASIDSCRIGPVKEFREIGIKSLQGLKWHEL